MGRGTLARFIAAVGAVFAAVLGCCVLAAAGTAALNAGAESLAYLDLSDTRYWRDASVLGARGFLFIGYAAAHAALCWRPADGRVIAARLVFTAAGGAAAVQMVLSALNAPPSPGCGMKWLPDLAPFLLAAGFAAVEVAAWAGWWFGGTGRAEHVVAPDPRRQ